MHMYDSVQKRVLLMVKIHSGYGH